MQFSESDEFKKDLKKLLKSFPSLYKDLSTLKLAIEANPTGDGTKHWVSLYQNGEQRIMKMRMMCRSAKGTKLRVTYYYNGAGIEVLFIEVYFKGDKVRESEERIKDVKKRIESENKDGKD